jgi:hypothetical protein
VAQTIIDLSIYLENDVVSDPPPYRPKIQYIDHRTSVPELVGFFPGLQAGDLPDGEAWAIERVELITHNGTHLDAPYHFASTMNGGERAITIDEVPLDWCFQPGVKLDFRHFEDGYIVQPADVEAELKRIGHTLKPLEIAIHGGQITFLLGTVGLGHGGSVLGELVLQVGLLLGELLQIGVSVRKLLLELALRLELRGQLAEGVGRGAQKAGAELCAVGQLACVARGRRDGDVLGPSRAAPRAPHLVRQADDVDELAQLRAHRGAAGAVHAKAAQETLQRRDAPPVRGRGWRRGYRRNRSSGS